MTQDAANQGQTNAAPCSYARKRVPKVVHPNVRDLCKSANAPPLFAKSVKMPVAFGSRKHPDLIARCPLPLIIQDLKSRPAKRDDFRACFAGFLS